jgi:hypothetical protein
MSEFNSTSFGLASFGAAGEAAAQADARSQEELFDQDGTVPSERELPVEHPCAVSRASR